MRVAVDDQEMMRVEVVDVNYYMAKPLPALAIPCLPQGPCYRRARVVPVVRIFGATPAGQKCCVHVHGIFPYFYMRCENDHAFESVDELVALLPKIAQDIEAAVRTLSQANGKAPQAATMAVHASKASHRPHTITIAKLAVVTGVPFYGYHSSEALFVKVFMYDPAMMSRIVQVVESGLVTQRTFQPYEAHIPYLLQVFADYHIEGMNYLIARDFKFRRPLPHAQPHLSSDNNAVWLAPPSAGTTFAGREAPVVSSSSWNGRTSVCSLELDVSSQCILNPTGAMSDSQCYVPSLAPLWEEEKLRRQAAGLHGTPDAPLSIPRQVGGTPDEQRNEASPLSQSDFNQQMWASLESILGKVKAATDASNDVSTGITASSGFESTLLSQQQSPHESIHPMLTYSQLDDGDLPNEDYKEIENAELLALLAILQNTGTEGDMLDAQREGWNEHCDDEECDLEGQEDDNEGSDIMASQQKLDNPDDDDKPWWEAQDGGRLEPIAHEVVEAPVDSDNVIEDITESPKATPPVRCSDSGTASGVYKFAADPPLVHDVLTGGWTEMPMVHYSCDDDVPDKPVVFAGRRVAFHKHGLARLRNYPEGASGSRTPTSRRKIQRVRTPLRPPPTTAELRADRDGALPAKRSSWQASQPALRTAPSIVHTSHVTILSVELHVNTREALLPDPAHDAVVAIGYTLEANEGSTCISETGLLLVDAADDATARSKQFLANRIVTVQTVLSEAALFVALDRLVHTWDPDFLVGFEVQQGSWGYLIDRATMLSPPVNLIQTLSRLPLAPMDSRNSFMPSNAFDGQPAKIGTEWGMKKASGIWMHGRHILNLWRCARSEFKLARYTFESVVAHVLKRRVPVYSFQVLSQWFQASGSVRLRALEHVVTKTMLNVSLLDAMQLITRTSEMARLFGIDFFSVLSRGSQYRVEAVNIRVTKRFNYIMISPNRQQVAAQPPMECIPLVMEPMSAFYGDPVVVLDFQSLYPSMMIAYNICYSTCLGRLKNGMDDELETVFGAVSNYVVDTKGLLESGLNTTITPNGVLFCPKSQRQGVMPLVLSEILSTRIMIKQAMKATTDRQLRRVLDARQMALKMIANVTYGYMAASFSGRMPCAQLADAIVQCGRTTLEAAVKTVESHAAWHARVVYGDTDSLFVQLRGRTLEQALRIGQEIANVVTAQNPKPVCLKLEKVYMGSFLVSKKRYVGLKFESIHDKGQLDAKGIETIRRDSCGVVQHPMRHWLRLLFATRDLSACKKYLQRYWIDMHDGNIPLRHYIFAKEVRLGTYAGQGPPGVLVAKKAMAKDHRAEPRYAERVAYVVVRGPPGARLMDLVVAPDEMVALQKHSINIDYYVTKQMLPSFERLAILMGVDVRQWYNVLPRKAERATGGPAKSMTRIDAFYSSQHCRVCDTRSFHRGICAECRAAPGRTHLAVRSQLGLFDAELASLRQVCAQCMGSSFGGSWDRESMACRNMECAVWNAWLPAAVARESWTACCQSIEV
ncbi:hypothetical protein H310_04972 [Aphanomyces invadans]|uniref:DNA polymerase n=1 Tax=Aphanomyces invadans TaxID=157072 RepID=A0A024UBI3_9STRA|nr:hypothetical protein H310_04972 [Aphanomyces invadans]ETW03555.1 hypothetical protein H310_04972 [Aphanomyces invadans]|eukprot:XP_008867784.1 hypothetical protein H310_04972 [Aphanomyces invadans]